MKSIFHKKSAFTLIELLVVIAIIGLLSSVVLVFVREERAKARDIQRITEAMEIKKALNIYLLSYGHYPVGDTDLGGWDLGNINHPQGHLFIQELVTPAGLFTETPKEKYLTVDAAVDSTHTFRYIYVPTDNPLNTCGSPFYVLFIKLERSQTKYNIEDLIDNCVGGISQFSSPSPEEEWYVIAETE